MTHDSERQILNGLVNGNPEAIAEVYQLFSRQLLFFARRITNNIEVAEDVVADVFLKLIGKPEQFDSIEKVKALLFKMTQNKAIDWLRAEKRHSLSHEQIRYLHPDAENEIERQYIRSEILQNLYSEIQKLSPKSRDILILSYLQGKSIDEISSEMHLAYKTVLNIKTRAVQQLRSRLMRPGDFQTTLPLGLLMILTGKI